MSITFKATDEQISVGRKAKPISEDVLAAIESAVTSGETLSATVSVVEAEDFKRNYQRFMRANRETHKCTLALREDAKGKVRLLLKASRV